MDYFRIYVDSDGATERCEGWRRKTEPVNPGLLQFVSVTLPVMVTLLATAIWIAFWSQSKRFDDLRSDKGTRREDVNRRFVDANRRIEEAAAGLRRLKQKFERTSPLG